ANCQYPQKFPEYLDNLHRLGIVEVYFDRFLTDEKYYEKLKLHPQFPRVEGNRNNNIVEKKSMYELSEFGKKFCKVCIS
ncbi:MAG: Abi-alpha family protein, partial [Ruminococcus sp.]